MPQFKWYCHGGKNATNCFDDKNDNVCWEGETRFEYEEGNLGENINICILVEEKDLNVVQKY